MERGTFNELINSRRPKGEFKIPDIGKKLTITAINKYDIAKIVADNYGILFEQIFIRNKKKSVVPRSVAMFLYRQHTNLTTIEIGDIFKMDHATVIHSCKNVTRDIKFNYGFIHDYIRNISREIISNSTKTASKIAYICHPIAGDVDGNLSKILGIVKDININEPETVPFAPYISDVMAIDDSNTNYRNRGIKNDRTIIGRQFIDECRVYGDRISDGMRNELFMFFDQGVPVLAMTEEMKEAIQDARDQYKKIFKF
jgi:hypothetical protein